MRILKTPFVFLLTIFSFSGSAQDISPAPADKAVIYFVRPSSFGFAINFSYFDSTQLVGKFNGPAYIRYTCDPGRHLFWARSENKDFVEAEVEAGKIYFIEALVHMGAVKASVELEPLNPNDGARMRRILKLIERNEPEFFSEEELKSSEIKMQDVIARGIEKYLSDKQKGKTKKRLTKDMYYNN